MSDDPSKTPVTMTDEPVQAPLAPDADKASALPPDELARMTDDIIAALKTVYDPEIPSDIYELGLIYKIDIADDRGVTIDMTLTTPNCPSAQELPAMVEDAASRGGRRPRGQGQHRLGSALGPEPDVGRGPRHAQYVVTVPR